MYKTIDVGTSKFTKSASTYTV